MCFFLAFKRIVSVAWNRREEQAADELRRINHVNGCPFLLSFGSGFRALVATSPPFLLGDVRKWHLSHQSLVTPTIRGKESSYMYGVRSFGSVPTCSGWGFSYIERFRPLRMTIRWGADGISSGRYVACFGTSGVILRYE